MASWRVDTAVRKLYVFRMITITGVPDADVEKFRDSLVMHVEERSRQSSREIDASMNYDPEKFRDVDEGRDVINWYAFRLPETIDSETDPGRMGAEVKPPEPPPPSPPAPKPEPPQPNVPLRAIIGGMNE